MAANDTVIVGGGIAGVSAAYYLARKGVKVTVIEADAVASCASGYAAGILNPLNGHGIPDSMESLAVEGLRRTVELAKELTADTGIDNHLSPTTCMWVAMNEAEASEFEWLYDLAGRLDGFDPVWLDAQEVRSLEPDLSHNIEKALHVDGGWLIDSYQYTLGIATAAQKLGVEIRQGRVTGIQASDGRVDSVLLEDGQLECGSVIFAMGPWMNSASEWLGVSIPVTPVKGQILRLEAEKAPARTVYGTGGGYISAKWDGLVWIGTTEEEVGFFDEPTSEARKGIFEGALKMMPSLESAKVNLQTACLRPVSGDGLPIVGRAPGWDNVILATGAGRKGILLGASIGAAAADLLSDGATSLPVAAFDPARFAGS